MQNLKSQSGRSMVEMLGVLAIIGVLSVGGISAYSVAMEKIKTNDLLAQVRQEAVLIAAQLATGKTNLTLSADNTIFTSVSMDEGSDNFTLTLSDIEEELCNNVKSMLGSNSMVQSINDDCSEMTFHKNLILKSATQSGGSSGGDSGTESGGNSGGSTEPADPCADIDCGDNGSCVDGVCECDDNYYGTNCENAPLDCQNGGRWNKTTKKCDCVNGYSGTTCETEAFNNCTDATCCTNAGGKWGHPNKNPSIIPICCTSGEPKCPSIVGACICVPNNHDWKCNEDMCISCETGEAICPYTEGEECMCVPDGYDWECSHQHCVSCEVGEAVCDDMSWECSCV